MLNRLTELFELGSPIEAAVVGGLSGFLAGSIVVLFNIGVTRLQTAVGMGMLFVVFFVCLTVGLNAIQESRE